MTWLKSLFTNPYIVTPVLTWFVSQVVKTIIHALTYKKVDFSRLLGDGGIPSCHSATVSSLGFLCLFAFGPGSFQFAISLILAIIVCHDAMGVRREAGMHAVILNKLIHSSKVSVEEEIADGKLNEFVGHTPIQVFAGVAVGFVMAIIMYNIFF